MRIVGHVSTGERFFNSRLEYLKFAEILPSASRNGIFRVELPGEDPTFRSILEALQSLGHKPWSGIGEAAKGEFWLTYERRYHRSDYEQSELLVPAPHARADLADRDLELADGLLHLEPHNLRRKWALADACWWWVVVRKHVRDALQASGLKGLAFRPAKVNSESHEWSKDEFWELTSTVTLPPLAPRCTLVQNDGTPFTGDLSKGCQLIEDFYVPAEFHYQRADLPDLGAFDCALTHEQFPIARPQETRTFHKLVVSQRFYRFCREQKFACDWIPVRIDPE